MCNNSGNNWGSDGCGCERNLKVHKLCAHCVETEELHARCIKAGSMIADNECVSGSLEAQSLSAGSINSNTLCSQSGTINSLCVDNLSVNNLAANNSLPYSKYRATTNFSSDQVYNLGSPLSFNNIVDDPNNSVILSPNTSYTAPISGYYMVTFKINITNLVSPSGPILGVPVADPQILVNGVLVREAFQPFLTFFNAQSFILSSLITLQAGDVVTLVYNVLGANGAPIVGTVGIVGSGIEDGNSLFKIILLSALASNLPPPSPCVVCPPVVVDCSGGCAPMPCPPCPAPDDPVLNAIAVSPAGSGNYSVSWNAVAGADKYVLEQSLNDSGFSSPLIMDLGNALSKSFMNQPNGTYYYRVLAENQCGDGPWSTVHSVAISAPGLAAPLAAPAPAPARPSRPAAAASQRLNWAKSRS